MSVVDPFVVGGQVRDDSWPFGSAIVISTDRTEPTTEPNPLAELCVCPVPSEVTLLNTTVEVVTGINCKAMSLPTEMQSTVLRVTLQGNACNSFGEVAASIGSGGTQGTGGGAPPTLDYFTGQFAIPMLNTHIYSGSPAVTWNVTDVYIDPADYQTPDGACAIVAAWFEIMVLGSSTASTWYCVDDSATVRATVVTGSIQGQGAVRHRVSLNLDTTQARTYRLKTAAGDFFTHSTQHCAIVIDIENGYRVKLPVAVLIAGDESTSTAGTGANEAEDNAWVWSMINSDLTYCAGSVDYYFGDGQRATVGKFLKDEIKFSKSTIESWTWEVIASQSVTPGTPGTGNGYAALRKVGTTDIVTNSVVTFSPGDYGIRREATFTNDAANFTDLAEFEPVFKVDNDTESIAVARGILWITLTAAAQAQFVAGRVINGNSIPFSTPSINTESGRYYHDGSKFPNTAVFYYEMTGQQRGTSAPEAFINDADTQDWGYQLAQGVPGLGATLTGSWSNPDNASDDGLEGGALATTSALFASSTSLETAELRLSNFVFTPAIPGSVSITLVNVLLRYVLEGQTALVSARVNANSYHDFNSTVWDGATTQERLYDATDDAAWVPGDFGTATVDIKGTHPANVTLTNWWINGLVLDVGWSELLVESELNFTSTVRVRQRSAALTLTDGHRYTALHPNSDVGTNKIDHSNGIILAEVDMTL